MILIVGCVVVAVFLFVLAGVLVRRGVEDTVVMYLFGTVFLAIAVALGCSVPSVRDKQMKSFERHGDLVQLLKLVDAKEDPVFSADVRGALARTIGEVNEEVATAKQFNNGLLDIWHSDVLAASEPLR